MVRRKEHEAVRYASRMIGLYGSLPSTKLELIHIGRDGGRDCGVYHCLSKEVTLSLVIQGRLSYIGISWIHS